MMTVTESGGQFFAQHVIERGHHLFVRARQRGGFHDEACRAGVDENLIDVVVIPVPTLRALPLVNMIVFSEVNKSDSRKCLFTRAQLSHDPKKKL
jgi:hypothetical protein